MTLGEWLDMWLELYVIPTGLAKSTKKGYTYAVRAIPAALASITLEELSPLDLRRWLLLRAEEAPRAAQIARVMLHRALTIAAKVGLCRPGLVDDDVCPQVVHKARKASVLTHEQLIRYMHAAAATDVAPALMLMCCGLRRGEAMGARWEHVDLDAGTLLVAGQRLTCEQVEASPLKSAAAYRLVELPLVLLSVLRRLPRDESPWLCSCGPHKLYVRHAELLEELGLPRVTLHGLRHSFATAAAASGVPIKVLQVSLGHAKYGLTADLYADHLPSLSTVSFGLFSA